MIREVFQSVRISGSCGVFVLSNTNNFLSFAFTRAIGGRKRDLMPLFVFTSLQRYFFSKMFFYEPFFSFLFVFYFFVSTLTCRFIIRKHGGSDVSISAFNFQRLYSCVVLFYLY
jgi:hypothetical protein